MLVSMSAAPGLDAAFQARVQVVLAGFLFRAVVQSSRADGAPTLCRNVCAALQMRRNIQGMGLRLFQVVAFGFPGCEILFCIKQQHPHKDAED
jgi:hypothetical protein